MKFWHATFGAPPEVFCSLEAINERVSARPPRAVTLPWDKLDGPKTRQTWSTGCARRGGRLGVFASPWRVPRQYNDI